MPIRPTLKRSKHLPIEFGVGEEVIFVNSEMTADSPVRIIKISVAGNNEKGNDPGNGTEPLTWDNLEAKLDEFADNGFARAVLVTRGGRIVL